MNASPLDDAAPLAGGARVYGQNADGECIRIDSSEMPPAHHNASVKPSIESARLNAEQERKRSADAGAGVDRSSAIRATGAEIEIAAATRAQSVFSRCEGFRHVRLIADIGSGQLTPLWRFAAVSTSLRTLNVIKTSLRTLTFKKGSSLAAFLHDIDAEGREPVFGKSGCIPESTPRVLAQLDAEQHARSPQSSTGR